MLDRPDRYPLDVAAAVLARPDGPESLARVDNVSLHGLRLRSPARRLEREESVWVELACRSGQGRVGLLGRVRWAEGDLAGVEIEAMLPHHRQRFVALLEDLALAT